ncbi:MAG: choice-of-anchor J domain-containing protein, partial [Paludibacter sp.]|nr:choice-of-anchor J domain-containing protein [Paludibacter sp.]
MKKKFTLLIALALIFSAANAQQKRGERINAAHQIEQGTISNGLTLMKATGTDVNTPMPVMRAPGDVLFSQNFNAATFPPTDWTMINSTGTNWVRQTTAAANGPTVYDGGFAWRADVDAGAGQYSYLITPQINIPATGSYALTFMSYIGYAGYYGASSVRISTTTPDRAEFTTVYTLAGSDIAQSWQKIMIGLSAYAGQSIYIAFVYGDPGDYDHNWGIDNVAITELNDNDLKITANAYPFSQVPTNQQLILSAATVTNNGSATQNNLVVNVTYNGAVIATETLSSLAPGAQHVFNFDAYVGYPVSGNNTLAYNVTQNESDAYIADNTFTTTFTGTSSIFATDEGDLTYSTYYGGTGSANYRFGTIYTFSKPTVLNRVQVYLYSGHATTANAYTLRVQQVTSPTTASATALVTQQFTVATPTGTTWATVTLPTPANLPAGDYFVSISCTTTANNLLGDNGSAGRNKCVATTSAGTALNYQSGSAFLHLVVDLQPNDIAITPTTGFPYAQIPQSIAGDLPFPTTLTATAINVGTDAQSSITLSATYNGADMGTSTPPIATLASGATSAAMTVTPPAGTAFPTTLGTNDVVYTVAQGETDANPGDNTVTRNFDITKDIYALDHIPSTITSGGVGYGGSTPSGLGYKVGNIFTISAPVTLKQVQI